MKPPYTITSKILDYTSSISMSLGSIESSFLKTPEPKLRKQNKIKTIQATLEIEGNTLSLDQVTAVLDGKRVLGPAKDILEVSNVNELYDLMDTFKSSKVKDFLKAHKILMTKLINSSGSFRTTNVGVLKGSKVSHIAPKPKFVPELMEKLFKWIENDDVHSLVKSCIAHYEIEFIHPFEDGNGRIGRFWQSLILKEFNSVFSFIPVESLINDNQELYYKVLERCDKEGESTLFIEFMLELIDQSLKQYLKEHANISITSIDRLSNAKNIFEQKEFSRKDYMSLYKNLSSASASRDLKQGVESKELKRIGKANQTKYQFKI